MDCVLEIVFIYFFVDCIFARHARRVVTAEW